MKYFHLTVLLLLCLVAQPVAAQEEEHYTKEIGLALGGNSMLNDANQTLYADSKFTGGAMLRFILNPRMAIKTMVSYNMIGGSVDGVKEFYPSVLDQSTTERLQGSFKGGITDLSATYELHFLPYGYARGYQNYRRFTPYVQFGFGLCYSDAGRAFTANIPIGVGFKWKIGPRINMALDWAMHLSLSDKLDNFSAPTGIPTEMFRGKDNYCLTTLTLSYDFAKKCPACQKAER
ncbi:MAG: DUF6089 family protein [Bacteroidales bacterium]|nr:DUF6089 family protein [Bacteroidales bacterium]